MTYVLPLFAQSAMLQTSLVARMSSPACQRIPKFRNWARRFLRTMSWQSLGISTNNSET